uniref:Ig-like domain-containing protein n=1 Tax=Xenopus tropicalis TaxID=8364 RepID=A0A6I8PT73_XENTR
FSPLVSLIDCFICYSVCGVLGDSVRPLDLKIFSEQGKNVSLSCSYSTSFSLEYYLYWYLQFPFREPEYILYKSNKNSYSHSADFAKNRFVSEVNSNYTTLTITDLKPEDSATYHCALQRAQCDRAKQSSYTNLRMEKNRTSSNSALTFPFQFTRCQCFAFTDQTLSSKV